MKAAPLNKATLAFLLSDLVYQSTMRCDNGGYFFKWRDDYDISELLEAAAEAINAYFKGDQNETAPQPEATPDDRL